MKDTLHKIPVPVVILLDALVGIGFLLLLNIFGLLVEFIPGIDDLSSYTGQLVAEIPCMFAGFGLCALIGHGDLLTKKTQGGWQSIFVGGFMVGYVGFALVGQIVVASMAENSQFQGILVAIIYTTSMFVVGATEELFCRGVMLNLLKDRFPNTRGGIRTAVILQGVLFGLLHFVNAIGGGDIGSVAVQVVTAGVLGILFGAIYVRTDNLWFCIIIHALVDFASLMSTGLMGDSGVIAGVNNISWMSLIIVPFLLAPVFVLLRGRKLDQLIAYRNGQPILYTEKDGEYESIWSLVLGIVGLLFSCLAGYSIGVCLDAVAAAIVSKRHKKSLNGMALAGLICGAIGIALALIMVVVYCLIYSQMDMSQMPEQVQQLYQ